MKLPLTLSLAFLLAAPIATVADDRPNLVFLLADDQATYSLGCYGNRDVRTPNIDGLAADGIVFDSHYDTTAICMASRASILTGNFEYRTGCNFDHGPLEFAGLPVPEGLDGKSLLPLLDAPANGAIHEFLPLINVWGPKEVHSFGVVTRDWKYVYWPWAEGDFEATEELYHLAEDPLELINYVADTSKQETLEELRRTYDAAVAHWKAEAVDFHDYQRFGTLFDRHLSWDQKTEN